MSYNITVTMDQLSVTDATESTPLVTIRKPTSGGSDVTVDTALSTSSYNPIANAPVASALSTVNASLTSHDVQLALLSSGFNELTWTASSLGYFTSEPITPTRDISLTVHINDGYSVLEMGTSSGYLVSDTPTTLDAGTEYRFMIEPTGTVTLATALQNVYVTNCIDYIASILTDADSESY